MADFSAVRSAQFWAHLNAILHSVRNPIASYQNRHSPILGDALHDKIFSSAFLSPGNCSLKQFYKTLKPL